MDMKMEKGRMIEKRKAFPERSVSNGVSLGVQDRQEEEWRSDM